MKLIYSLILVVAVSFGGFSQYPNRTIEVIGTSIAGNLPYNYPYILKGEFPAYMKTITITINGISYTAYRDTVSNKFELYVPDPLPMNEPYTYKIVYIVDGSVESNTAQNFINTGEDTKVDNPNTSSQFAPIAGIGIAGLGVSPEMGGDMFGHVGFKFYFTQNVDRRNKVLDQQNPKTKVYPKFYDRFGMMLAGGVTTLAYKGKALDNPVFNFYPMLGVTFDILPELSIDAGAIFFDYNNVDSSIKSSLDAKLKMGFFFTVSMDVDAFTRLRTLINGHPYIPKT